MTEFYWIMEYVASFIEISMCCVFGGTFLTKEKLGDRKYLLLVLSGVAAFVTIILNRIEIFSYITSIVIILIVVGMQFILYRGKVGLSLLLTIIYMVILASIDFSTAYFTAFILNTDAGYLLNEQSLERVVCILLSKTLLIFIVAILHKLLHKSLVFIKKYVIVMFVYSVFLLVSLFVMVELNMDNGNPRMKLFLTSFFIVSVTIELSMFYFLMKTGESYEQRQKAELMEMKNNMLQKSLDETEQAFKLWRRSVHDYKNNIIALRQLADDGKIEEIREYLNRESELIDKKMFYIKTGSSVVDAIVNTKQSLAEEKNITFVVNAVIPEKCDVSELDFANILGNLIDNAIEACDGESEPYIDLAIKQEKNFIVIKIVNKYSGEFSNKLETTKNKKMFHGIGIGSVKSIVEKYEGQFSIEKKGTEVVANILIPNF